MNYGGSTSAFHWLNGDTLPVSAGHFTHPIRSKRARLHFSKTFLALKYKLTRLEMKEERGRLARPIARASQFSHPALGLPHSLPTQFLRTTDLLLERLLVELLLLWGWLSRRGLGRNDDARQKRRAPRGQQKWGHPRGSVRSEP